MTARPGEHHADPAFATTLAHGLSVLQAFRHGEPALSNRELSDRTGLSKATISRLTTTLMQRGLLRYDAGLRRYRLGTAVLSLSYPLLASIKVRQLARPLMKRLADAAGGSASLGMHHGLSMVYVETCRGHDAVSFRPDIGALLPLLPSAMGRACWRRRRPARPNPCWRRYGGTIPPSGGATRRIWQRRNAITQNTVTAWDRGIGTRTCMPSRCPCARAWMARRWSSIAGCR